MTLATSNPPSCIIVSVDKAGHVNQCLALAELMGWRVDQTIRIPGSARMDSFLKKQLKRWQTRNAQREAVQSLAGHTLLNIIASGAAAEAVVIGSRKRLQQNIFAVFVGTPKRSAAVYDMAISSRHAIAGDVSPLPSALETAWITGVLSRPLPHQPKRATTTCNTILIGGTNKAFTLDATMIAEQLRLVKSGLPWRMVFSRRTPAELEFELRQRCAADTITFIDRSDRNGFLKAMHEARMLLVTPDSISMICEARATGKPVAVFDLPCFDPATSTARFYAQAVAAGWVSKPGQPVATPTHGDGINDAVAKLTQLYAEWRKSR